MDAADEREFLEFARARSHSLFRSAYALTGRQHGAEDLVQVALTRTAARWQRVRDNPEPYARKIVYHEFVSGWRRRSSHEVPTAQLPDRRVEDGAERTVTRLVLWAGLARLAPRQRAVLVLRFLEDRSEREVAELLGCRMSTVSSQVARALARLREVAPELSRLWDNEEAPA